jgi:hypothetical protein
MSGYESALVGLVQILEELMQSGTTPDRAGHELASAIAEQAISLFGPSGPIVEIDEIARIAGDVEKLTALYGAMRRGAKIKHSEGVWLLYLKNVMVLRDDFKMAFGIISDELEQPQAAAQKARPGVKRGAKPKFHWDILEMEARRLMDYHGDFHAGDLEWNAQARLEEVLLQFHRDKWGTEPGIASLRIKIAKWLPTWRREKGQ